MCSQTDHKHPQYIRWPEQWLLVIARVGKRSCASDGAEYAHAMFYYAHAFSNKRAYFRSARTHTNVITTRNQQHYVQIV